MALQLSDAHCVPPGSQVYCMDSSNSEKPKCTTSKDLPLPQSTLFPALLQQKSTIYHSQRHVHERFGVNEINSGKSKEWNWYERTHIPSAWPDVLLRFVPSLARGIQQPRTCMAFSCPIPPPILSNQQSTGISCSDNHPLDWFACRPSEIWRLRLVDDW